jgi:hypothetical protein
VIVWVVQAERPVLSSAVKCAVLALLDAGVIIGRVPMVTRSRWGRERDDEYEYEDAEEELGGGRGIAVVITDAAASSSLSPSSSKCDDGDDAVVIAMYTFGSPMSLGGLPTVRRPRDGGVRQDRDREEGAEGGPDALVVMDIYAFFCL